jgi:hypothetical protein
MQATASSLIDKFAQGDIRYIVQGAPTGPAWDPQPGADVEYPVKAVKVAGQRFQTYVDNGLIVATDVMLAVSVFDVEPTLAGRMKINGVEHQIVMVDKSSVVPGTPLVWMVGCRK